MPSFSARSRGKLSTCHPHLRHLFEVVVERSDCTILEGVRSDERQAELFRQGRSKLDGVSRRSRHQRSPDGWSEAVDVAPYPIDWAISRPEVAARWLDFARLVLRVARELDLAVRWGGDWDGDWDWCDPAAADPRNDQAFHDWPHWELR